MLNWFSAREATEVGAALADDFVLQSADGPAARRKGADRSGGPGRDLQKFMQKFLQRVDRDARPLKLNLFKRAKLANSFKWRLLEKGVEKDLVDELTQALVLRLTASGADPQLPSEPAATTQRRTRGAIEARLTQASEQLARGAYAEAAECYQEVLASDPRNFMVRNNLGVALCRLGRYHEAGDQFRQAIGINASCADAHANLGSLLRSQGRFIESEQPLRRALKLKPTLVDAQISLAGSLFQLGRLAEARALLEKVLKIAPRSLDALVTLGHLASREGRFAEAEGWFNRAVEVDANAASSAWVGLAALRRMTQADDAWLRGAQASADSGLAPLNEANVRYAIGKYYDELGEFARAFKSYQRANELVKTAAEVYDRDGHSRFMDDLIRTYPADTLARSERGASDSTVPVFVVGMPRSGTTLVEQIIASHPSAKGAGELEFWSYAVLKHHTSVRHEPPGEATRRKLAEGYLRVLTANSAGAARVVDKSPFNSQYLGVIHSVFPKARVIHVRRDPIDTCLSCYFQDFPPTINFKLDLDNLAHFYRGHHRLIEHWRSALPAGTVLDVPYEELVADQRGWTGRMLEFLGLPWDDRCLSFGSTERSVLTASYWQVRQKIYSSSIGRWRKYEKFIGPLLALKGLD